ncbi:unnamed protein product, partial [Porites evermanni]
KYLFLEASEQKAGEGAILVSSIIGPGKSICVQFWYHTKGKDVGSLKVYIQTNQTKTLVWNTTGEQGDKWNFGQVGYKGGLKNYKVILEGVVGSGIYGDIAVDDLSLLSENICDTITGNELPGCLFEQDHCAWKTSDNWRMSKLSPLKFLEEDWQNTLGGFTYLQGCSWTNKESECYGTLKSRRILPEAGWNCMQLWYYLETIGSSSLKVSLIINETKAILWSLVSHQDQGKTGHWMYLRLPIDAGSRPYQVLLEGQTSSKQAFLAVDDIAFQTEGCEVIPWQGKCDSPS